MSVFYILKVFCTSFQFYVIVDVQDYGRRVFQVKFEVQVDLG